MESMLHLRVSCLRSAPLVILLTPDVRSVYRPRHPMEILVRTEFGVMHTDRPWLIAVAFQVVHELKLCCFHRLPCVEDVTRPRCQRFGVLIIGYIRLRLLLVAFRLRNPQRRFNSGAQRVGNPTQTRWSYPWGHLQGLRRGVVPGFLRRSGGC